MMIFCRSLGKKLTEKRTENEKEKNNAVCVYIESCFIFRLCKI